MFKQFNSWAELLTHVGDNKPVYYHAPLDRMPVRVTVIKMFKNGKLRIAGPGLTFTADKDHFPRFCFKK